MPWIYYNWTIFKVVPYFYGFLPLMEASLCFISGDFNSSLSLFCLSASLDAVSLQVCRVLVSGCSSQSGRASACWAVFSSLCSLTQHKVKVRTWARPPPFQGQQGPQGREGFHHKRPARRFLDNRPFSRNLFIRLCLFRLLGFPLLQ